MSWRFFATRLHGDGTETLIADELPVQGPRVMRALSGFGGITGGISPQVARLTGPDGPVLVPGRTGIYAATEHGAVRGGGILTPLTARQGAVLRLDAVGHAGFLDEMPYLAAQQWVQVDPADLIRHAWAHVQARPHHNLGMVVDALTTPVRVGTEERQVSFDSSSGPVEFTAGPVKWNPWSTHDLAREINRLATATPIDYTVVHARAADDTMTHRLRLGYPRLGRRRTDLDFTVGVNVTADPEVATADDVSEVLVLGAGEGAAAKRGRAYRNPGGLGRTVVLVDKTLTSVEACNVRARQHLAWFSGQDDVTRIVVTDHRNAPLGSWAMGDDIRLRGNGTGWAGDLDVWVRVLSDETNPITRTATLTVTRAGRAGA